MDWSSVPPLNFPFISILITLLGSEVVGKHLESSTFGGDHDDWRRISALWSSFGLLGVITFYVKLILGTHSYGRGAPVTRAGVHDDQERGNLPTSSWSSTQAEELLSVMTTSSSYRSSTTSSTSDSTWINPIFIAIGYSRRHWSHGPHWLHARFDESPVVHFMGAMVSLIIMTAPTMMLLPSLFDLSPLENAILYLQVASSVLGTMILSISMHRYNTPILEPLSIIYEDRLFGTKDVSSLQDGDLIISDARRNAHVVWQNASTRKTYACRNSDITTRALAGLSCLLILCAFFGTYTALRQATRERQYLWLGAQVSLFALRFAMWSGKKLVPSLSSECFLYLVTGSLVNSSNIISITPPAERLLASHEEKLDMAVVRFAWAASNSVAKAKERRRASGIGRAQHCPPLNLYSKMANNVPSDILCVQYVNLEPYVEDNRTDISVLRLSWDFVREVYRAQGVILGYEPRNIGGIYLAAVFVENTFVGLTTVHPFDLHAQNCTDTLSNSFAGQHQNPSFSLRQGGFTRDGYFVTNLICGAAIVFTAGTDSDLSTVGNTDIAEWHNLFRGNVAHCRSTAKPNGPSFAEIRISKLGLDEDPARRANMVRLDDIGEGIRASAYFANKHGHCCPDGCRCTTGPGDN